MWDFTLGQGMTQTPTTEELKARRENCTSLATVATFTGYFAGDRTQDALVFDSHGI